MERCAWNRFRVHIFHQLGVWPGVNHSMG
jgi:hypothetical protein